MCEQQGHDRHGDGLSREAHDRDHGRGDAVESLGDGAHDGIVVRRREEAETDADDDAGSCDEGKWRLSVEERAAEDACCRQRHAEARDEARLLLVGERSRDGREDRHHQGLQEQEDARGRSVEAAHELQVEREQEADCIRRAVVQKRGEVAHAKGRARER